MRKQTENSRSSKHEKGSITLFILIAVLFFIFSVIGIIVNVKNNKLAQEREIHKIQESYQISNQDAEQIYQEELDKAEGKIDIMLIKKTTWNTDKKEYFYNTRWYTTKGEGITLSEGTKQKTATIIFSQDMNENVQFRVIDTSDNVSDIKYHTIRIDKTLPVFSIQTDGEGVRKTRNITIKLDDKQGSGITENSLKQYQLIPTETKEIGE